VARAEVDFALGTDTAGSGRVPAAFNNLIGLKPTRGVFSMTGVVPACRTLDCVSVLTRDVRTAERIFRVAAEADPEDWSSRRFEPPAVDWGTRGFRFGVPSPDQLEFFGDRESPELFVEAIAALEEAGGTRVDIDFGPFCEAAALLYSGPWLAERLAAIEEFFKRNAVAVYPVTRQIIGSAEKLTAVETFRAMYRLGELRRATAPEWAKMDVLLLPTTGTIYRIDEVEAEPIKLNTNLGYYTNFVNLLDLAAIAIPAGFRKNGTPFGVSLIGPAMTDAGLCALASRIVSENESARRTVALAVVGAHLTGQPLNHQLIDRRARLLKTCRTASHYRLYALANTTPPKPGLVREEGFAGPGIELEVWSMPERAFGGFVAAIPPPLGIGAIVLDDGSTVRGFICEPAGLAGAREITHLGGWRAYLATP
jgi:allophanate hydrolase